MSITTEHVANAVRDHFFQHGIMGDEGPVSFGIGHREPDEPSNIDLITETGEHFIIRVIRAG